MIYVGRNKVQPPAYYHSKKHKRDQKKVEDFYQNKNRKDVRIQFDDESWIQHILPTLLKLFNNKCAFCETEIPTEEEAVVDQFRPRAGAKGFKDYSKDHYGWLAYEWGNQYLVCKECHRFKGQWFPVSEKRAEVGELLSTIKKGEKNMILDPCKDRPMKHFVYDKKGKIKSQTENGEITIRILKLNRPRLVRERAKVFNEMVLLHDALKKVSGNKLIARRLLNDASKKAFHYGQSLWQGIQRYYIGTYFGEYKKLISPIYLRVLQNDDYMISKRGKTDKVIKKKKKKITKTISAQLDKHIYLDRIHIKNYKCFDELKIKFPESATMLSTTDGRTKEPWMLFLGENGVGKSSILKGIALCLMDDMYRKKLKIKTKDVLRNRASSGFIDLYIKENDNPISFKFNKNGKFKHENPKKVNLVGYGATRVLPKGVLQAEKGKTFPVKTQNLFDYTVSLNDAKTWLLKCSPGDFAQACIALKDLMLLDADATVKRSIEKKEIWVNDNGQKNHIEQLSDGYQTVIAVAVDIMSTLIQDGHSFDSAEGVVLIDELGTHLHPTWKMAIVDKLRNTFPKIQFIATTHEPLCLRGLSGGEIVLLRKVDDIIHSFSDLPDPTPLRVDQLLTSDFFGLHSTIDPAMEKKFQDYYTLLAKPASKLTKEEKARLKILKQEIPGSEKIGDNLREDMAYYVVDQVLAKKKVGEPDVKLKQKALDIFSTKWENKVAKRREKAI